MAVDDSYTKVLLHFDGADGSTTFTDESAKTWTRSGDAQIDTAKYVFGGASGLFDGTGDYITTPNSSDFDFGTGNFTLDMRVYPNGAQGDYDGILSGSIETMTGWAIAIVSGSLVFYSATNAGTKINSTSALPINTWSHIAIVRNGTSADMYINGTHTGSTWSVGASSVNSSGTGATIARLGTDSTSYFFNGWVDECRISKGIARWTGNFTPPTAEYSPSISVPLYPKIMIF